MWQTCDLHAIFEWCQNEQKQDAWFHYSIVRIPLFINVSDHFPVSWFYSLTSHVDFKKWEGFSHYGESLDGLKWDRMLDKKISEDFVDSRHRASLKSSNSLSPPIVFLSSIPVIVVRTVCFVCQDCNFVIKKPRLLLAIFKISSRACHKTGLLLI
jgi:hypothetical protein